MKTTDNLLSWSRGQHEGKPISEVKDDLEDRIQNRPDEKIPGRGEGSTRDGESFNESKDRFLAHVQAQVKRWKAPKRIVNVTHGHNIHVLKAWIKKGAPADRSIDTKEMLKKPTHDTGDLILLMPRTMKLRKAKNTAVPGIYFARHGATADAVQRAS